MSQKNRNKNLSVLIYGKHPAIAALNNVRRKCINLFTTKEILQEIEKLIPKLNIPVTILKPDSLNAMLPLGTNHQNIILESLPLASLDLEDIIEQDRSKAFSCLILLDQVTDPHNIGAIIRSAAAFSASAVILTDHNSPKENNTIIKCAAGACETVPMIHITNLASCIKELKKECYWIIGLDGHTDLTLKESIFSEKIAIIMGSEDKGLRKLTKENCDYIVKIPISSSLESLNVSNAAAIALYEFAKYRDKP